jgi:hypothetical protein
MSSVLLEFAGDAILRASSSALRGVGLRRAARDISGKLRIGAQCASGNNLFALVKEECEQPPIARGDAS